MRKLCLLIIGLLIFSLANAQFKVLLNFNHTNGSLPRGSFIRVNDMLYGMAYNGGTIGMGCAFKIDTNGTLYKDFLNFNNTNGADPEGDLTLSGRKLFGTTYSGGSFAYGNIFSVDTDGTHFKTLRNFYTASGNYPSGNVLPAGAKLYGTTTQGGTYGYGNIYTIDTNGNNYKELIDVNGTNGMYPGGTLIRSGIKLFGVTTQGGTSGDGVIFSMDTNGKNYKVLLNFNLTNGKYPGNPLLLIGSKLYGMAVYGGKFGVGCIYSIDSNGNNYKDMFDFNSTDGEWPGAGLMLSGSTLYGATGNGGPLNYGNIFSIDTDGTGFKDMFDFNGTTNGGQPSGSLTLVGTKLYGTAEMYGSLGYGVIFSLGTCEDMYTEPLCIATVDTATNKCEIIWGRTNSPPQNGAGYYNVYRDTGTVLKMVHTQALNVLSEYIDLTSDPSTGPESYELSTGDSCGESALSTKHTTMFLTTTSGFNVYKLNWTAYVGFTPSKYRIFRGPSMHSLVQIDSVASTVLSFHDTLPPIGSYYAIEAVNPSGACIPTTVVKHHNITSTTLSGSFSNGFNTGTLISTGIENNSILSNIKIYPNPGNGIFNISYSLANVGNVNISIIDELGQVVYANAEQRSAGQTNEQINLENLAAGIYSLRLQTSSGITVKKLVVMKK